MSTPATESASRVGARATKAGYRGTKVRRQRVRAAWMFLIPMLITLALVAGWPLARTFYFSFTDASLSDTAGAAWIGIENYLVFDDGNWYGILTDPVWWQSVWNTLFFSVVSVSLEVVFGIIVALLLNAEFKGRMLMMTVLLLKDLDPNTLHRQVSQRLEDAAQWLRDAPVVVDLAQPEGADQVALMAAVDTLRGLGVNLVALARNEHLDSDTAAMLGLIVAFIGIWLAETLKMPILDGVASVVIGAPFCTTFLPAKSARYSAKCSELLLACPTPKSKTEPLKA